MMNKKFRVNDLVKYNYSEIGEYIDENHTDKPLRNDEVCDLLNKQQTTITELKEENEQLKLKIDGLAYALTYIKRIDVEIDLNE